MGTKVSSRLPEVNGDCQQILHKCQQDIEFWPGTVSVVVTGETA